MTVDIRIGDCRELLRAMPDESVHCVVTSPPYFGLRDYGVAGQIGLEPTPEAFVAEMVAVFREVRRVLRADGTLWLNLGDSYTPVNRGENAIPRKEYPAGMQAAHMHADLPTKKTTVQAIAKAGFKQKDLMMIPARVALALQADGWWLRSEIIWHKPNPMPESITDRPTSAHEKVFLLAKAARYFYDAEAVREPLQTDPRENYPARAKITGRGSQGAAEARGRDRDKSGGFPPVGGGRNLRNVWTIAPKPFKGAHFATFPPALVEPCIKAGCPAGGVVLDPFGGAGTTGLVAQRLGRDAVLVELNPAYAEMARRRIAGDAGMFADVSAA